MSRNNLFNTILPKNSICAEIGVAGGGNAELIIKSSQPKKIYLIDIWDIEEHIKNYYLGREPYVASDDRIKSQVIQHREFYENIKEKYKDNKNVEIIRELSVIASTKFDDNYFDWVYIDAGHSYVSVKEDIESWWPKVKSGGYLCGHDYDLSGVKKSVDEFCKEKNITNSTDSNNWYFKKL